ncbi:hypothetical protein EDD17DRAFT_1775295 [Pisolithus thermaeus]|nr:hypothetical protein EDD17DRAFT_1775295 [Pisolithus thermaeus]
MAKGAAKRIAGQNERAIKNLRLGMVIPTILSLVLRLLLRRDSLPPSKGSLLIYVLTYLPALFLSRYLENIGTSRRDPTTGALISSGEDLNQPGVTEWSFDVLYVTWACQVGSGAFGEWFWYFLSGVWTGLVGPFLWPSSSVPPQDDAKKAETSSKRQEKLRKRSERGDQRVRASRK